MAKTLTFHSRTTFWAGVRALLSFDIGFSPFSSAQFHLLGFGFNVIHFRSGGRLTQFSITLSVPFYIAGFYYLPTRQDDTNPPEAPLVIRDTKNEAFTKARIGANESAEEYVDRIIALRSLVNPSDRVVRTLREVDKLLDSYPHSPEYEAFRIIRIGDEADERQGRRDSFAEREGLVTESADHP